MQFVKLTAVDDISGETRDAVYIALSSIHSMLRDHEMNATRVISSGMTYYVAETPEEIMRLMWLSRSDVC